MGDHVTTVTTLVHVSGCPGSWLHPIILAPQINASLFSEDHKVPEI
jgi:hypothetical protein